MSGDPYDPNSHDAVFSRILANQDEAARQAKSTAEDLARQIAEHRAETTSCFQKLTEDVTSLKLFRANLKGKVAIISGAIGLAGAELASWLKDKIFHS